MSASSTSSSPSCAEPISWLRLERYHLGEDASPAARERVSAHLETCRACAAVLAGIASESHVDARTLPPLAIASATKAHRSLRAVAQPRVQRWYARPRVVATASGLLLAALVVLAIGRRPESVDEDAGASARMKGSDISFALVREDEALIAEAGGSYRDGERFKALVTCAPDPGLGGSKNRSASFDVVVFENGVATFPLPASTNIACGNVVALPGAFRTTGHERMTVCLVWEMEGAVDREAVSRTSPDILPRALCKTLDPTPTP